MSEATKDEPLNQVNPESYYDPSGGPEYGGANLASAGPIHESTIHVCPVPGSPAADGVFAGRHVEQRAEGHTKHRGRHSQDDKGDT